MCCRALQPTDHMTTSTLSATTALTLTHAPKVLVLHLKRFKYRPDLPEEKRTVKLDMQVGYP